MPPTGKSNYTYGRIDVMTLTARVVVLTHMSRVSSKSVASPNGPNLALAAQLVQLAIG